jgi:hypothetical protein
MTILRSVHIGLNAVDATSYGGPNPLQACEADARAMSHVARAMGFTTRTLLTREATCSAVLGAITSAGRELTEGDLLFITCSSHGGQVPDADGDEPDRLDETWCLFDSQLRDDDINGALATLRPGVRVLMLSDSCHSGTVSRSMALMRDERVMRSDTGREKHLALSATIREFEDHVEAYAARATAPTSAVRATGALISGCRDDQVSMDGDENGAFTSAFLTCWDDGRFDGDHNDLHQAVTAKLYERGYEQVPMLTSIGTDESAYVKFLSGRPLRP